MENKNIRRHFDEKSQKWYFSVVDIVALTTSSKNPRNYWKVLKNRLKLDHSELVSKCNRLKMRARDGKNYLTDSADMETVLELLTHIPGANEEYLREYFHSLTSEKDVGKLHPRAQIEKVESKISTSRTSLPEEGAELLLDMYQDQDNICVEVMVGGVEMENLEIELEKNMLYIRGTIQPSPEILSILSTEARHNNSLPREIYWGSFLKAIPLPCSIRTEMVRISHYRGHMIIKLPKLK